MGFTFFWITHWVECRINDDLDGFVTHFCQIYREENAVCSVHWLVHLSEEFKNYGSLDSVISFPFENILYKLRRFVRKSFFFFLKISTDYQSRQTLRKKILFILSLGKKQRHGRVPDELTAGTQYQVLKTKNFVLKLNKKDGCVRIGGDICLLNNIIVDDSDAYIS